VEDESNNPVASLIIEYMEIPFISLEVGPDIIK